MRIQIIFSLTTLIIFVITSFAMDRKFPFKKLRRQDPANYGASTSSSSPSSQLVPSYPEFKRQKLLTRSAEGEIQQKADQEKENLSDDTLPRTLTKEEKIVLARKNKRNNERYLFLRNPNCLVILPHINNLLM